MGIPKFYSRMHAYGANETIGRRSRDSSSQSQSQSALAVVDGPSLAHFLFDELMKDESTNKRAECFYRYSAIGQIAIEWLDYLCSFGFELEGIYFDGALPLCKRQTRLNRLHKYADNLKKYKQQVRYAKDSLLSTYDPTQAYCYQRVKRLDRSALIRARRNLPPPPFLVAAVIEALTKSHYAAKTWVVDGEADEFCAAAAHEVQSKLQHENIDRPVHILTNDSDLLVWRIMQGIRITIIREIGQIESESDEVLKAHCFGLNLLSKSLGYTLNDLVNPAFRMRDPKVTFPQALKEPEQDLNTTELIDFAAQHDRYYAFVKLTHQRFQREKKGDDLRLLEPRVSELVRQYLSGFLRNRTVAKDLDSSIGFDKVEMTSEATEMLEDREECAESGGNSNFVWRMSIWKAAQIQLEPVDPFYRATTRAESHREKPSTAKPPMTLEMFLPALLEDPECATAWRIGTNLRDLAETLIMLPFKDHQCTLLEYSRSGSGVSARSVPRASNAFINDNNAACLEYFRKALHVVQSLDVRSQWRFLVMHLTLSDRQQMQNAEKNLKEASPSEILCVINGKASSGWSKIHLFAQYQAEYFSLRMLKDIVSFCKDRTEFKRLGLPQSLLDFGEMLDGLPNIGQFFATDDPNINLQSWEALSEQFVKSFEDND